MKIKTKHIRLLNKILIVCGVVVLSFFISKKVISDRKWKPVYEIYYKEHPNATFAYDTSRIREIHDSLYPGEDFNSQY